MMAGFNYSAELMSLLDLLPSSACSPFSLSDQSSHSLHQIVTILQMQLIGWP